MDKIKKSAECTLCLDTILNPKQLKCFKHTFCKACVDEGLHFDDDGSASIKCPFNCDEISAITANQTADDLVTNYPLLSVLDALADAEYE